MKAGLFKNLGFFYYKGNNVVRSRKPSLGSFGLEEGVGFANAINKMLQLKPIIWPYLCLLLWLGPNFSLAQSQETKEKVSGLEEKLSSTKGADRITIFLELSELVGNYDSKKGKQYAEEALKLSKELKRPKEEVISLINIGNYLYSESIYPEAMRLYSEAYNVASRVKEARMKAHALNNIGNVLRKQSNPKDALEYYQQALEIYEEEGFEYGMADVYNNMSLVYGMGGDHRKAIELLLQVELIRQNIKDSKGLITCWNNLGDNYADLNDFAKANYYQQKARENAENIDDKRNLSYIFNSLGRLNAMQNKFRAAKRYFEKSISYSKQLNRKFNLAESYNGLMQIHQRQMNYDSAFYYQSLYHGLKDSLFNIKNNNLINSLQESVELAAWQAEVEQLNKEKANARIVSVLLSLLLIISVGGVIIIVRTNSRMKKINKELKQSNESIKEQNLRISSQNALIEKKSMEMDSSLRYAGILQRNMLPIRRGLGDVFEEYFVLLEPKSSVSGDIYWYYSNGENDVVAALDCRGHGVPGALTSVLATKLLEKIVVNQHITKPDEILRHMHESLLASATTDYSGSEGYRFGIDMSVMTVDRTSNQLCLSSAMHNMLVTKGNEQIIYAKGNRLTLGSNYVVESLENLEYHELPIEKGMTIYMFSDGYPDQFGGPLQAKFGTKRLRNLFIEISNRSLEAQKHILKQEMFEWMGGSEQIDDMLVIGVRL